MKQCKVCKKDFSPPLHNERNGHGIYCSRSCAAKVKTGIKNPNWRGGIATQRECVVCGQIFAPKNRDKKRLNKYCSVACRGRATQGESNPNWKGGRRSGRKGYERDLVMGTKHYRLWRKAVLERDDGICQLCGISKKKNMVAHHIYNFSTHPELRYAINNGIILCQSCHSKISAFEQDMIPYFLMLINPSEITRRTSGEHSTDEDMIRSVVRATESHRNDVTLH